MGKNGLNCGIKAMQGMLDIKNLSMYSLIHIARDNGMNLYFCRVDKDKLPLVKRPAIFHSEDHFVLVEDEKPIPQADYSGWVLTPIPFGTPLPHSLAKQVFGAKKGGDIFGPIVTGIVSIVGGAIGMPFLGALASAGFQGYKVSGGPGVTATPGQWWNIPLGGALGYLGGAQNPVIPGVSNSLLAGGLSAAGQLPNAIKTGNYGGVLMAGLGGYAGQQFTSNAAKGFADAAGQGLGNQIGSAFKAGVGSFTGGQNVNTGFGSFGSPGATQGASGASGTGLSSGGGLPQGGGGGTYGLTPMAQNMPFGVGGISNVQPSLQAFASPAGVAGAVPSTSNLLLGGATGNAVSKAVTPAINSANTASTAANAGKTIFGLDKGTLLGTAGALVAGQLNPAPKYNPDSLANYNAASKYLQGVNLPSPTMDQLHSYVTGSISDIKKQIYNPDSSNQAMLELDKMYQMALNDVQRQAAQSGQSVATSSDAQNKFNEVQRQYAEAKSNLAAQLDQQATSQAIQIKQWALQQSIAQGQFDMGSALELAAQMGLDQQLKYAVQANDYQSFQTIVAHLLNPQATNGMTGTDNNNVSQSLFSNVLGQRTAIANKTA